MNGDNNIPSNASHPSIHHCSFCDLKMTILRSIQTLHLGYLVNSVDPDQSASLEAG